MVQSNTTNIKMRIRFSKTGTLRFIGHLDFLRVFQQAIRRAGLPIAYSQGFNPHQIISFALPLPLGMESINDYADITLTHAIAPEDIIESLNKNAPVGLVATAAYPAVGAAAAAATMVADYTLDVDFEACPANVLQERINGILSATQVIVAKKTKSGIKDTDIRPDIIAIELTKTGISMRLYAGSGRFLNPITVCKLLLDGEPSTALMSRVELYKTCDSKGFVPL